MRKTIFKKLEAQGLIANYNRLRKALPPKLPERVFIFDETLREGVRTPSVFLTYVEKVKLAKMIDETGVSMMSVGYPALSDEEKNNVKRISNEGFQQASLVASAKPVKGDIDACLECGIREISIFTPVNGLNLQHRLKLTKEQILDTTADAVAYAKKHGAKVDLLLEDGTRTPVEDILKVFSAAAMVGADRLGIADSLGFLRPLSMRYLISHVAEGLSEMKIKTPLLIQCHNDFGLATANTLAAVEEGVSYVSTCVAGFGQRSGMAPLEEVVAALELLYDVDTGTDLDKLYRLSQLAEKAFALPVQFHKPVIGDNAFSREIAEMNEEAPAQQLIYEPFPPEIIGRQTQYLLGRQIGKRLIEDRLKRAEIRGSPMQVDEIIRRIRKVHESADKGEAQMTFYQIKKLMRELRRSLTEDEFWKIVEDVTKQKPKPKPPETSVST